MCYDIIYILLQKKKESERMKEQLAELESWGCKVEDALERTLGDEDFLVKVMKKAVNDNSIAQLGMALKEKNCKQAFEAAHDLKGVMGNVGLTPIYKIAVRIVEPLRNDEMDGTEDLYKQLVENIEKAKGILME